VTTDLALSARGVRMEYRDRSSDARLVAIEGMDLDVADGEFVSLLGPSGCGKSTFLKIVNGLLKATAGELALGLESWTDLVAARGYDPEELLAEIQEWQPKLVAAGLSAGAAPGIASLPPPPATADNTAASKG